MIWYDGRLFRPVTTEGASETTSETIFRYTHKDSILTGTYSGGDVRFGHLIGLVDDLGCIDMRYHHLNKAGDLMTGLCRSTPEVMENGKLRLHENWQWTCGDRTQGTSILEEI